MRVSAFACATYQLAGWRILARFFSQDAANVAPRIHNTKRPNFRERGSVPTDHNASRGPLRRLIHRTAPFVGKSVHKTDPKFAVFSSRINSNKVEIALFISQRSQSPGLRTSPYRDVSVEILCLFAF